MAGKSVGGGEQNVRVSRGVGQERPSWLPQRNQQRAGLMPKVLEGRTALHSGQTSEYELIFFHSFPPPLLYSHLRCALVASPGGAGSRAPEWMDGWMDGIARTLFQPLRAQRPLKYGDLTFNLQDSMSVLLGYQLFRFELAG